MPSRLSLSATQIEDAIESFTLEMPPAADTTIEWKAQAPSYTDAFDAWITEHRTLPSQEQFVNLYMERNSEELDALDETQRAAARARAVRAYPSLVRKFHFKAMAMESDLFDAVETASNKTSGADVVVHYRGQRFAITCVNRRSRRRRKPTEAGAAHGDALRDVALPFNAKKAKRVGELLLYTERDLAWLVGQLDEAIDGEKPDTSQDASDSAEALDDAPTPSNSEPEDVPDDADEREAEDRPSRPAARDDSEFDERDDADEREAEDRPSRPAARDDSEFDERDDAHEREAEDRPRRPAARDDSEFGELVDWDAAFEEPSGPLTPPADEDGPALEFPPEPTPVKDQPRRANKREDGGRDREDVPPRNRASAKPDRAEPDRAEPEIEPKREPAAAPPRGDTPSKREAVLIKIRHMLGR